MPNESTLHIIELRAENIKRLRAVRIRPNPDGSLVIIGGKNAQGKTSVLDAIEIALGGGKSMPAEPVRHGARKARSFLDLGELTVERVISAKGTTLVVRGKDGAEISSPQTLLDKLCARVTFDPLEFTRLDGPKQDELLKRVLGLNFAELDAARAKLYAERAEHKREAKKLAARVDVMPEHRDAPPAVLNVSDLTDELQRRSEARSQRQLHMGRIDQARRLLEAFDDETQRRRSQVDDLRGQIEQLEQAIAMREPGREEMLAAIVEAENTVPDAPPIEEVQERIRNAETVNAKVRANLEREKLAREIEQHETSATECNDAIAAIDEDKAKQLAEAKFPVPGLAFDADVGAMLNGVPLKQASQAELLRLSVAIGAALNPRVKVMLVREGEKLDDDGLRLLAELAAETGSQVFVERVGTRDAGAIIIEDGEVVGEELAQAGQ